MTPRFNSDDDQIRTALRQFAKFAPPDVGAPTQSGATGGAGRPRSHWLAPLAAAAAIAAVIFGGTQILASPNDESPGLAGQTSPSPTQSSTVVTPPPPQSTSPNGDIVSIGVPRPAVIPATEGDNPPPRILLEDYVGLSRKEATQKAEAEGLELRIFWGNLGVLPKRSDRVTLWFDDTGMVRQAQLG